MARPELSTLSTGTHLFPPGYRHDHAADWRHDL